MSFKRLTVSPTSGQLADKLAANYLSWLCHTPRTYKQSPKGKQLPATVQQVSIKIVSQRLGLLRFDLDSFTAAKIRQ